MKQLLLVFVAVLLLSGKANDFNAPQVLHTDFDGNKDVTELTDIIRQFTATVAGVGGVSDFRFNFKLDAVDENTTIGEAQANDASDFSVPTALWLMITGIIGLVGINRTAS